MHEENEACAEGKRKGRRKKHRFEEEGIAGGGRGKGRILGGGKDSEAGRVADGCVENISPIRLEGGMCWFGRPECGMNRLINMWALFRNMYTTFLNHKYEILTEKE